MPRTEEKIEAMIEAIHDCAISEGVIDPYLEGCIERVAERGSKRETSMRSTGRDETRPRLVRDAVVRF